MAMTICHTRLAALTPVILALIGCGRQLHKTDDPQMSLPTVATIVVQHVPFYETHRTFTGQIAPARSVELAFELDGRIIEVLVDEGQHVETGAVLARLDTQLLEADQAMALARRDEAAAKLAELRAGPRDEETAAAKAVVEELTALSDLANAREVRQESLVDQQVLSQEEVDVAVFGARAAKHRLAAARQRFQELLAGTRPEQVDAQSATLRHLDATLERLRIQLDKSQLRAPFSGRVARRWLDEGATVTNGMRVLRLLEDHPWEARVRLPVDIAKTLAIDQAETLRVGEREVPALARGALPELDSETLTAEALFVLDSEDSSSLFEGELVSWTRRHQINSSGVWLPMSALVKSIRGLWACYVLEPLADRQGVARVVRRDLEVMHFDLDRAFVRGALQDGDRVVPEGRLRVVEGQLVQFPDAH